MAALGFAGERFVVNKLDVTSSDLAKTLETSVDWVRRSPGLILNQSGTATPEWLLSDQPYTKHSSYLLKLREVHLFGSNHLITEDKKWCCESGGFNEQYIDFFNTDTFAHFFPGPKPRLSRSSSDLVVDFGSVKQDDITKIDDEVFLATPHEPDNWGRWISTVIPKVRRYVFEGMVGKVLVRSKKQWQKDLLRYLGVPDDKIIDHDPGGTYHCRRLTTICYSATDLTPTTDELAVYREICEEASDGENLSGATKIFVSRLSWSRANPHYRILKNELELIERLEAMGFVTIQPDQLSFKSQVRAFGGATTIVGLGGSGMFNVVFAPPGACTVTIEASDRFLREHSRLLAATSSRYGVAIGRQDVGGERIGVGHRPWTVDVDKFVARLGSFL